MKRKLVVLLVVLFIGTLGIANAYVWPTDSLRITSWYGPRNTGIAEASTYHRGVDIGAVIPNVDGDPCYAVGDGEIVFTTVNGGGSGKYIELKLDNPNGDKIIAKYLHLSQILVSKGDRVQMGQVIGKMGKTGIGNGTHLDFRVQKNGSWVNLNSYVEEYKKNPNASASTMVLKCPTCGSALEAEYHSTGTGMHYRECINKVVKVDGQKKGHHVITAHNFDKSGKCACGVFKCNLKDSKGKQCGGIVEDKYMIDKANEVHYKICSKNPIKHHFNVGGHNFMMGKCVCGEIKIAGNINSSISNRFEWIKNEAMSAMVNKLLANWENNKELTVKEFNEGLKAILIAKNKKVISEKTGLKDDAKITREQAAFIMGAYVEGTLTTENLLNASDWSKVNKAYRQRINKLVNKKIFRGREIGGGKVTANPNEVLLGAEGRVLLSRLFNAL